MRVAIIGTGNLGTHLCKAFGKSDYDIAQVCGRTIAKAKPLAEECNAQPIILKDLDADVVIIAVSDDYIDDICRDLPDNIKQNAIVAHTSGTRSLDALEQCQHRGVFYPLNTFSKNFNFNFSTTPILLNGSKSIVEKLRKIANVISNNVSFMSDIDRKETHLSAVIICNFTNHLIYLAKARLEKLGIDSDVLEPLLVETIRKQALLNPFEAQTGPARRKDTETMEKHIKMLNNPQVKELYRTLSESILKSYT